MFNSQCQSIVPACGEVTYFDFIVASRLSLTPQQETFLGTQTLFVNVADGEAQNQGPDQAEDDLAVAVDDIFGAGVCELNPPTPDEVEGLVDVFELLHAQLWSGGIPAEGFVAEDLEEVDQDDLGRVSEWVRGGEEREGSAGLRTPSERSVMRSEISTLRIFSLLFSLHWCG
jgi:hypothetical protein